MIARRTWCVRIDIRTPLNLVMDTPSEGSAFGNFTGESYPAFTAPFGIQGSRATFGLSPLSPDGVAPGASGWQPASLYVNYDVDGNDFPDMQEIAADADEILDQLSIWLDFPVTAFYAAATDITDPVEIGEERRNLIIPNFSTPKNTSTLFSGSEHILPLLSLDYPSVDAKLRAALRWYTISMEEQPDVQRFMALWISLELLVKHSDISISGPMTCGKCRKPISNCPHCNEPTDREINGPTIKAFLMDVMSVDKSEANALWQMRQMFHGSNDLTAKKIVTLPSLLALLIVTVRSALFSALKISPAPPLNRPVGTSWMTVMGSTAITKESLGEPRQVPPLNGRLLRRIAMPKITSSILPPRNPDTSAP